jgi:hypothetical protein
MFRRSTSNKAAAAHCLRVASDYLEWIGQRDGTLKDLALIRGLEAYRRFVADYQDDAETREHIRRFVGDW